MLGFVADSTATFDMSKLALPETSPDAAERTVTVCRRDLDPLGHVNNSVYIDYLEEALEAAGGADMLTQTPRRYEIDFVAAAERDNVLTGRTWQVEGGWAYRLSRPDGSDVFRARVTSAG
jgi:acyl-CoA thioesterase FadM